jgi:hypothetical protein
VHVVDGDALQHDPLAQTPAQVLPQEPQLLSSELRSTSQPSVALPLQSANPMVHEPTAQAPDTHVAVASGKEQADPHPPQLAGFVARSAQ